MAARKPWSDLSERTRRLLIVAGVAEASLKTAALIDIKRRPTSQIRGSKWVWAMVLIPVGSFGACHSHTSPSGGDGNQGPTPSDMRSST
jgi:hypothetical protein